MATVDEGKENSVRNTDGSEKVALTGIKEISMALVSLKEIMNERDRLYMQKFEGLDKANTLALSSVKDATAAAMAAAKEAVTKAETAVEKRLESVNEFRGQQKDMITGLSTKDEVGYRFSGVESKIETLQRLVYIGMGAILAIQFLLKFFVK